MGLSSRFQSLLVIPLVALLCFEGAVPLDSQTPPLTTAPTCLDLMQVRGPVIEIGREGGNIFPYLVTIDSMGKITTSGPVRTKTERISPLTVRALVQLASAESFWALPKFTGGNKLADIAIEFVTVNLSCTSHKVAVRGSTQTGPFAEIYALLLDLTGLQPY